MRTGSFAPCRVAAFTAILIGTALLSSSAQTLNLPPRPSHAPTGSEFAARITPLALQDREKEIVAEVLSGNVPDFLRRLCAVSVTNITEGKTNTATYYVTPDYLAIGSDADYFLMPISPNTGQRIADALQCSLPTPKMVNDIYAAAEVKLPPVPIYPTPAMTTVPVFSNHNAIVRSQRAGAVKSHPLGALVAGTQKDVVICAGLATVRGKVAIYGWHQTNGVPIQPLYLTHAAFWVDYSQCTRLVQQKMSVNGQDGTVAEVLGDVELASLLSNEGTLDNPRYPTNFVSIPSLPSKTNTPVAVTATVTNLINFHGWTDIPGARERQAVFTLVPDVKIHINAPSLELCPTNRKVLLIFYALPNGNTTEQTIGRILNPGDDWHFNIQHIAAQTRFLRNELTDRTVVVVYLESRMQSWPAWRKQNGDKGIPGFIADIKNIFTGYDVETVISGHSGGGSFIFGFINAVPEIPNDVVRIAFLDSNYGYDLALGHREKLVKWLGASDRHYLIVLAYNDAVALLKGKHFVSEAGGTWGKSHSMVRDFSENFKFTTVTNDEFQRYSALDGRFRLILKENPKKEIFHTVQVERNGFIHCIVYGTRNEEKGYQYFGPPAYTNLIRAE